MNSKLKTSALIFTEAVSVFVLFLLQYSVSDFLKIGNALPSLLLALVLVCGFFFGISHGMGVGLIAGILMDSVTVNSICFYALIMMLLGVFAGLLATNYLNNNFRAALALGAGFTGIFFIAKWLFFYVFKGTGQGFKYLLKYALPSFIYTVVIFVAFYFLFKFIKKRLVIN